MIYVQNDVYKAAFGSCKSISGKYPIFWKCYFPERKMYSGVWLRRNSFYGKSILVFGSYKHFMENDFRFTENQFPCLVQSNILRKINSHVWFVDHFTENNNFKHLHYLNKLVTVQKYSSTSTSKIIIKIQASALPKHICNSTKIFIHFNIKNNHLNIPIILK